MEVDIHALAANRRLIGISNSTMPGMEPLAQAEEDIRRMLTGIRKITLLPYALADRDAYADALGRAFQRMGVPVWESIHQRLGDELHLLADAEAIYIGGGSTPRLVANLHGLCHADGRRVDPLPDASRHALVDAIRRRAAEGMPVMGASAGCNVLCADIRTTNDMPIAVWQQSEGARVTRLDALGLLPPHLSINPHYLDKPMLSEEVVRQVAAIGDKSLLYLIQHQGESRAERLEQALEMDSGRVIIALREGAYLVVEGMRMTLRGVAGGLIFRQGQVPMTIEDGEDLSGLL